MGRPTSPKEVKMAYEHEIEESSNGSLIFRARFSYEVEPGKTMTTMVCEDVTKYLAEADDKDECMEMIREAARIIAWHNIVCQWAIDQLKNN